MSKAKRREGFGNAATGPLEAHVSVEPSDADCCPPPGVESSSAVGQSLVVKDDGTRLCEFALKDRHTYHRCRASDDCPLSVFSAHDCVWELEEISKGTLEYRLTIPDRSVLAPIVDQLRESGATVSVTRLLAAGEDGDDTATLTDKQRETLWKAIESGYYDRPRGTTLEEIADDLGITTSAASQRLTAVRRRLIENYVRKCDGPRPE